VNAFTHWEGVGVVEHLHLGCASLAVVDSAHAGILLVQPGALHVRLLLRIVGFRVNFANQVGNLMDALLFSSAQVTACKRLLSLLEVGCGSSGVFCLLFAEVVSVLSAVIASIVSLDVLGDDCAETLSRRLNRSVDKGKLSNVVLVDHAQDGLFFAHMNSWVLNFLLVRRLQFSLCSKLT